MFSLENTAEQIKKYLYYKPIAAHPYYLIRDSFKDQSSYGLFRPYISSIYNDMNNKRMKKKGEVLP
jgi:hypothetical protein